LERANCCNTACFGNEAENVVGVDIRFLNNIRYNGKIRLIVADGRELPFKNGQFDLVSLFSVLEHIPDMDGAVREAFRGLRRNGGMLIQLPNEFFPVDLHSGLPLINYLPSILKNKLLRLIRYEWLIDLNLPNLKRMIRLITKIEPKALIVNIEKIVYPEAIITASTRRISKLFRWLGIFHVLPYGYLLEIQRAL